MTCKKSIIGLRLDSFSGRESAVFGVKSVFFLYLMVKRVNFRFDREDSKLEGLDPGILEYWGGAVGC